MNDLIVAITILGALSLLAFTTGFWLGRRGSSKLSTASQASAVILLAGYLLAVWDQPLLVQILPISGLIILANWLPLWGAFFVGMYATSPMIGLARRSVVTVLTLVLSAYSCVAPLFGTAPKCAAAVAETELQYQTTSYTCSPAAAATVLRLHGIDATEKELADLCLTRHGTHWLGLYRGLKLKTENTDWMVVAETFDSESLQNPSGLPYILSLNIDTSGFDADVDHGFVEGMGHSVVCLESSGRGYITVFDPSPDFGVEVWNHHIIDCVSSGVVLRLVARHENTRMVEMANRRTRQIVGRTMTAGL